MSKLSPTTRALFDAARDSYEPTGDERARVRRKLAARLGATALVGSALGSTAATTAAAGSASTTIALGLKVLAGLALVGGIGGGSVYMMRTEAPASPTGSVSPYATAAHAAATMEAAQTVELADGAGILQPAASAPPVVDEPPPAQAVAQRLQPSPRIAAVSKEPTASASGKDAIVAETALLDEAQSALRQGHPSDALRALEQHRRQFSHGALREEQEGTRILALCSMGRVEEAKTEAGRFLRRFPLSPLAPRIRASCAGR